MSVRWIHLASALMLVSCATVDMRTPEEIVESRAKMHLDLLHEGQWDDAMGFTTPGFRSRTTPAQYASRYGGVWMWQSTRIGSVTCDSVEEPSSCSVQTYLTFALPPVISEPSEHYRPRTWIKVDGEWYIYEP